MLGLLLCDNLSSLKGLITIFNKQSEKKNNFLDSREIFYTINIVCSAVDQLARRL